MLAAARTVARRRNVVLTGSSLLMATGASAGSLMVLSNHQQHQLRTNVCHTEGADATITATTTTTATTTETTPAAWENDKHWQAFAKDPSFLPKVQATARALRLVSTAVLMAADYKLSALQKQVPTALLALFLTQEQLEHLKQREHWEYEVEARRKTLQETQQFYSRSSHHHLDYAQRIKAKRREKEAMLDAAERLAQAQEALTALGPSRTSQTHQKAANRLLELCRCNKGVYIKIGQYLANLDYLLPQEYISTLSSLFNDTPQTCYDDVAAVIAEDLGAPPNQLFANFETEPIASASLAQVHVAYDKETGRKLAVKVQHRGLRDTSRGDILALVAVVRAAERMFPNDFTYGWLADEIAPHLPKELDFQHEGQNAERAANYLNLQTDLDCIVPKVIWNQTSARVLTMEFEEGFKATDVDAMKREGLQRSDVAKLVSSVFSSQVFGGPRGWVHCDPHPANVLVRPSDKDPSKPQIVLLDHGLYRELDDDFRVDYAQLWKSLMLADLRGIKEACSQLGVGDAYPLFAAVITARPFDELIERSKQGTLQNNGGSFAKSKADQVVMQGYAQRYIHQIFDMLAALPRQMLLLLKMNDCLRHIDHSLGSPTNTMVVCGEYAARAVYHDELRQSSSWIQQLQAWWNYMKVVLRIRIHDAGVWWLQQSKTSHAIQW